MNFEEMISINKYHLPEECEKHAGYYHQIADALADAKASVDEADSKLKLMLAEADTVIRANWTEGDGKMTEAGVAAKIASDSEILKMKEELRKKQASVYTLDAARSAMDHRKSMLDNLTQLLIKGFYATPNGGAKETTTEEQDRALRKQRKAKQDEDD